MIAEASVPRPIVQRWRWLAVFLSGLVLWILSVVVTGLTQNSNLIPTVVLLGSFLVPATAVIYYLDHSAGSTVSGQRVFLAFLYGGVLGVLAASVLEAWLLQNGPLVYVGVGLIEEFVKVVALMFVALGIRHFTTRDGIVLGAAVGFGFAALESSGYALNALFTPNGLSLTSVVFSEVLRGVLAPVGHGLWTGILGGALFTAASKRGRLAAVFSWRFIGLFLLVSLLHALWDSMREVAIIMTLLVTSSPALGVFTRGGLLPQSTAVITWIFLTFEFGGIVLVSALGLWMLRRAWRRSRPTMVS